MVNCASVGEKRNSTEFQPEESNGSEMKKPRMGANDDGDNEIEENQSVKTKSATEDLKTKIRKYLEENRYYWTLLKQFNIKFLRETQDPLGRWFYPSQKFRRFIEVLTGQAGM